VLAKDLRCRVSWEDFQKKTFEKPMWLIEPYVPRDGIVFLWGETSTGKSPVGWHLAGAIGKGTNFFGLPATEGRVLYLEVDTPQRLVHDRVKKIEPVKNVDFLFLPPLSVPEVDPEDHAYLKEAAEEGYDCVIVNTLRKVHDLNDKEPQTPKVVYSYFQHLFPGSALVFVHHTKKTQVDQNGNGGKAKESFSGAMNWLNDAQVGLHLTPYVAEHEGVNVRLNHEKSQVSRLYGPLGLKLETDGATLRCPRFEELLQTYELFHERPELRGTKFDSELAKLLKTSDSTAFRRRKAVENGEFPGASWLGLKAREG
jgi:hypothetical protein